jgi:hypothetical protein
MDVGMLWFDDDPRRNLEEKVARAVAHYKEKYGQMPSLCFVNPGTLNGGPDTAAGVQIKAARTVLPNHFWVGVGDPAARTPLDEKAARGAKGSKGTAKRRAARSAAPAAVPSAS